MVETLIVPPCTWKSLRIYIYITLLYCSGAEDLLASTERYKLPVKDIILPINKTISHGAIGTRKQGAVNLVSSTV